MAWKIFFTKMVVMKSNRHTVHASRIIIIIIVIIKQIIITTIIQKPL